MNQNLASLNRMSELDPERAMFILNTVLAFDTETASGRQRRAYRRIHANVISMARAVIRDFTSNTGLINVDHPAWQLGIDTTAAGPTIETYYADHVCDETTLSYVGHHVTPGRGVVFKCRVCSKSWDKIADQYSESLISA